MKNIHKIGLGVGATALVLGSAAGFAGLAQADGPTASPTPAATTDPGSGTDTQPQRGRHKSSTANLEEQVAKLAEKLGVDEAQVSEALTELETERQAERAAARAADLKERLDQAVKDGTLTQAEADAVSKAVEAGVLSGGGRGDGQGRPGR